MASAGIQLAPLQKTGRPLTLKPKVSPRSSSLLHQFHACAGRCAPAARARPARPVLSAAVDLVKRLLAQPFGHHSRGCVTANRISASSPRNWRDGRCHFFPVIENPSFEAELPVREPLEARAARRRMARAGSVRSCLHQQIRQPGRVEGGQPERPPDAAGEEAEAPVPAEVRPAFADEEGGPLLAVHSERVVPGDPGLRRDPLLVPRAGWNEKRCGSRSPPRAGGA